MIIFLFYIFSQKYEISQITNILKASINRLPFVKDPLFHHSPKFDPVDTAEQVRPIYHLLTFLHVALTPALKVPVPKDCHCENIVLQCIVWYLITIYYWTKCYYIIYIWLDTHLTKLTIYLMWVNMLMLLYHAV